MLFINLAILDRAERVDHAVKLLGQYDIHDGGNYAHHLFISDSTGNAVVVEWKENEMKVVRIQPNVTNFNLCNSDNEGFRRRSCIRYE